MEEKQKCERCGTALTDEQAADSFLWMKDLAARLEKQLGNMPSAADRREFIESKYCRDCFEGLEQLLTTYP